MGDLVYSAFLCVTILTLVTPGVSGHDPRPPVTSKTSGSAPLRLTLTPAYISTKTSHVTLHCEVDVSYGSKIETLYWMRILKKIPYGWSLVAQVRDSIGAENNTDHVTAVGHIGSSPDDAYLMVRWNNDDGHVFGEYVCDALGIDQQLQFVVEKSAKLSIKEQNITTQDLLELMTRTHSELRKETEEIADDVEENSSQMTDLLSRIIELERQMKEHVHDVSGGNDTASHNDSSTWPGGNVGLLMPESGCPNDPAFDQNKTSFVNFHIENLSNRTCTNHQPHFHLSEPFTTENNNSECFVNLRFCEASNATIATPWPEGSYCLNWETQHLCPPSFQPGRVVLDQVDGTRSHAVESSVVELSGTYTYLHFCCKETRPYDVPMVLPTDAPFYLYRFGGVCQNVEGMKVSREYIDIDTEDRQNGDSGHGVHPDIVIQTGQPTRIELCYYTRRTT